MSPINSLWTLDILVAAASAALMLWAFSFYYERARRITSGFSVGLAIFAGLFLVQNLAAVFFYYELAMKYSADVALPLLTINGLSLGAFATLVWVVRR
jgi:hypothetical protein